MTQPDQGLKARLDADDFGKSPFANKQEIALYDAWHSDQLITLSDHEAAVKAAVDAEREACAMALDNKAAALVADASRFRGGSDPRQYRLNLAEFACKCAATIRARANGGK